MQIIEEETKKKKRNLSSIKDKNETHKKGEEKSKKYKNDYNKLKLTTSLLESMPPEPLLKRRIIPIKIAKFAKRKHYIKLEKFNENSKPLPFQYKPSPTFCQDPFEKLIELSSYINSQKMISKLVYLRDGESLPINKNNITNINPSNNINDPSQANINNVLQNYNIKLDNVVNLKKLRPNDDEYDYEEEDDPNIIDDELKPFYTPIDKKDSTLQFESRFECGNLLCAFKTEENKSITNYQLILNRDTNTTGYIQWFFFRITNTKKGGKVNLTIINMLRKRSKYNNGIGILCYSRKKNLNENIGWYRTGENVMYYQNNLIVYNNDRKRNLHSLSFDYVFDYDDDEIFFANIYPYTYTHLMEELREIQVKEEEYSYVYRKTIYTTLGGNDVDMITINTDPEVANLKTKNNTKNTNITPVCYNYKSNKKGVIIIARQHPGETVGSYVMRGVIEFLLSDKEEAKKLRDIYVFKIVPMVNPDGVIEGNSRTSYAGCDLNRRWENPDEVAHGEIYSTKEMILNFASHRTVDFIIDLHGHSGAYNSFFYCNYRKENHFCHLYPFTTAKASNIINYNQCKFSMPKFKKGTGRIHLFHLLDLDNIETLETSMYGVNKKGPYQHCCYTIDMLKEIGRDVCLGMLNYVYQCEGARLKNIGFEDFVKCELKESEKDKDEEEDEENKSMEDDSDSEPSIDNFDEKQINNLLPKKSKKKKKKRRKSTTHIDASKKNEKKQDDFDDDFILFKPNNRNELENPKDLVKPKTKPLTANIKPKVSLKSKISINCNNENKPAKKKEEPLPTSKAYNLELTKEVGTQTEAIFFKMHWSFFVKDYVILEGRSTTPQAKRKNLSSSKSYGQMSNSKNKYGPHNPANRFISLYQRYTSKGAIGNMNNPVNKINPYGAKDPALISRMNKNGSNGANNMSNLNNNSNLNTSNNMNKYFRQTGRLFNPTKLWDN